MSEPTTRPASPPQRVEGFWIDVRDHMPDDEMTVLAHTKSGDTWRAFHEAGLWRDASNATVIRNVTHWMDLPEPPKEAV